MYGGDAHEEQASLPENITLGSALRRVVGEGQIWKLSSVYLAFGFSYIIYLTFFIAYLTKELGMSTTEAGRIFALLGFLSIFCGLPWGSLSDRIGRRYASTFGHLTLAISFLLFACYLRDLGLVNEQIKFRQRFFVPTDADKGVPIMTELLARYPVIAGDEAPGTQSLPVVDRPAAAEVRIIDLEDWVLPPSQPEESVPDDLAAPWAQPQAVEPTTHGATAASIPILLDAQAQSTRRGGRKARPVVEEQGLLFSLQ